MIGPVDEGVLMRLTIKAKRRVLTDSSQRRDGSTERERFTYRDNLWKQGHICIIRVLEINNKVH